MNQETSAATDDPLAGLAVHYAYATPIVAMKVPGAGRLNAALKSRILARREQDPKGVQSSNDGAWHSSRDFTEWGGPEGEALLSHVRKVIDHMTVPRRGQSGNLDYHVRAWANICERGHGHHAHTHPESLWSGTYYVDDGRVEGEPVTGILWFDDPRVPYISQIAPSMTVRGANNRPMPRITEIAPISGLLVLFPSWLSHAVDHYTGSRERVAVAFNFYPKQRLDALGSEATQR